MLAPRIGGARFLDGYAGTGAVGIEALSRGASEVMFVERDRRAVQLIEANLARCGVRDRHAIIRSDLGRGDRLANAAPFDIVFLDPPYGAPDWTRRWTRSGVDGGGYAASSSSTRDATRRRPRHGALQRTRTLPSGDSALTFYRLIRTTDPARERAGSRR